jgi:hypothetical protein
MVYRKLYCFTTAYHSREATDPVAYLASNATWLGILKRKRKHRPSISLWWNRRPCSPAHFVIECKQESVVVQATEGQPCSVVA